MGREGAGASGRRALQLGAQVRGAREHQGQPGGKDEQRTVEHGEQQGVRCSDLSPGLWSWLRVNRTQNQLSSGRAYRGR